MRTACSLAFVLTLFAAPAVAADHHVPQSTLAAVGLGDMEVISDAQGAEVRGMSRGVMAMGTSVVSGILIDPHSKSFLFGSDANAAAANGTWFAQTHQFSAIDLQLLVAPTSISPGFHGQLIGGAGGSATAAAN